MVKVCEGGSKQSFHCYKLLFFGFISFQKSRQGASLEVCRNPEIAKNERSNKT